MLAANPRTFMKEDEEHLRLLSIFHYVVAGLAGLISMFPVIYLGMGLFFIYGAKHFSSKDAPPVFLGWILVVMACLFILLGLVMASLIFYHGRSLARRKHYTFCQVMAGVECLMMPFGTVLGIFTFIVLGRSSVRALFDPATAGPGPGKI
jgi:preprotein translocase subunit SecG